MHTQEKDTPNEDSSKYRLTVNSHTRTHRNAAHEENKSPNGGIKRALALETS